MRAHANGRAGRFSGATVQFQPILSSPVPWRASAARSAQSGVPAPVFSDRLRRVAPDPAVVPAKREPEAALAVALAVCVVGLCGAIAFAAAARLLQRAPSKPLGEPAAIVAVAPLPATVDAHAPAAATVTALAARVDPFRPLAPDLPAPPEVTAGAYLLVDLDSGATLAERNSDKRVQIASLTKIATALAALSLGAPDTMIEISTAAAAAPPNRMGLVAGDRLSLEELLYGLLLDSGNDAAMALGEGLGGVDRLVERMNGLADELDLRDTHFSNPAGYDGEANYSTPRDLASLTRYGLESAPLFSRMVATPQAVLEARPDHGWYGPVNLNRLLTEYPGAFGVKTGYTDGAGYTLVAGAMRNGKRLLVILLGAEKHFSDGASLLDYGFGLYAITPPP